MSVWKTEYELEESFLRTREDDGDLATGVLQLLDGYLDRLFPDDQKRAALDHMTTRIANRWAEPEVEVDELEALLRPEPRGVRDVKFLPRDSTVFVVGDSHGDASTTEQLLVRLDARLREGAYCVFLGDYVNNGLRSVANLALLLRFQRQHPDRVTLLGGNHEVRETYATAVREYFLTHWDNATTRPFLDKQPPAHYGHLRLELATTYGVRDGERLYRCFAEWGSSLPYIAFVPGPGRGAGQGSGASDSNEWTMLSHSIGLADELRRSGLSISDLVGAKASDRAQHGAMVNNRHLTDGLLRHFRSLGVRRACVGHMHYRSGLEQRYGGVSVHTLCSSRADSADAGHYMFQEMVVERMSPSGAGRQEGLPVEEARPCIAELAGGACAIHQLSEEGLTGW